MDNVRMDLREVGACDERWLYLAKDRMQWQTFVATEMNLQVPTCSEFHLLNTYLHVIGIHLLMQVYFCY